MIDDIGLIKQTLAELKTRLNALRGYLDYDQQVERLAEVNQQLEQPDIWNDPAAAQTLGKERAELESSVELYDNLNNNLNDCDELLALAIEEQDSETIATVAADLKANEKAVKDLERCRMFNGKMDSHHAYLDIQAGSGGTEAQDWASMLLRMYLRWGERHRFKTEITELSEGEVAGIKSATIKFSGKFAFGWLRTETGIHRLVRKSPFNANNKRHTSFASVFVYPEVDDNIEIEINPADLRTDTYRASGAGGQHVNRTDSAVRITHLPTSIVVQCQSERSQHQNRANAMKQLRAKLYEREMRKQLEEKRAQEAAKSDIGWGHQIRSYVLDESRIKDLRTGVQNGNTKDVLDGNIDAFLEAALLEKSS
ncbi:MAG: peptide chain release factor 2 [Gammaproteobacteria bacterium]|nr:peptide chain release factor 2 [Gammaproteobacteria bacterium]